MEIREYSSTRIGDIYENPPRMQRMEVEIRES